MTRNHTDLLRAFRLMLFNVQAHNRDDHAKNFSFILNDATSQWALSPAYDLTFAHGPGGEHSTSVAGEGRTPGRHHFARLAKQYAISQNEMESMSAEVAAAVKRWPEFADTAGVSRKMKQFIAKRHLLALKTG